MNDMNIAGRAAIVGLGATEFSKNSGRTELRLAMESVLAALADAGIDPSEVEGFSSYTMDKVPEYEIARLLGCKNVKFFSQIPHGGGAACAPVVHAAMAVATGIAKTVVVFRAMNERSWYRFGTGDYGFGATPIFENVNYGWYMPYGFHTPAAWVGMFAQRYMHSYGATSEDFGRVSVAVRDFAAHQPGGLLLRQADHAGRTPGLQVDRRTAAPPRLLPGIRWCGGDGDHLRRAGPRPQAEAGDHQGRLARHHRRPAEHDLLLPRRHHRPAGDGRGGQGAVRPVGPWPGCLPDGGDLRSTSRPSFCRSWRSSASASAARPRISSAPAITPAAASCPSTPTAASWARPTSTA